MAKWRVKMEGKRIGLDLDGVLYPFSTVCFNLINEAHGYKFDEIEFWRRKRSSNRFFGKHREEIDRFVRDPNTYLGAQVDINDIRVLNSLAMYNEIFYITARSLHLEPVTKLWLMSNGIPHEENLFMGYSDKKDIIKELKIDVYVDDREEIVRDVMKVTDAYLFHAKYLTREDVINSGLPYISTLNSLLLLE